MYTIGSLFYAIYFFVGFPVFFHMDEDSKHVWSLGQALRDSLASGMAVTILLDLWRITFGAIADSQHTGGLIWTPGLV